MQKEHLENLTLEEKIRWKNSVNTIITKCITAGKKVGCERNIEQLRVLYDRIGKFWKTSELCNRYDSFLKIYSEAICFKK